MAAVGDPDNLGTDKDIVMARIAEKAGRYVDMANFMEKFVLRSLSAGRDLSSDERKLLVYSYKKVIDPLRSAWCVVHFNEQENQGSIDESETRDYRVKIESEMNEVCGSILKLLRDLIPLASSADSKVTYLKTKGDYHRYMAEYQTRDNREAAVADSLAAYKEAREIARLELPPCHAERLWLALNFSVFYYEHLKEYDQGSRMARQAYEEALPEMGSLSQELYSASENLMEQLRSNLTDWCPDDELPLV
ncbi:hypothetical protein Dimus_025025 [Dionaea muscipula]